MPAGRRAPPRVPSAARSRATTTAHIAGKQGQVCHQQERGEHRDRGRQAAERRHRLDEPVERAGEVDAAGEEAERQRTSASRGRGRRRCGGAPARPRAASARTRRRPGARTWGSSAPAGRRRGELARNPGVELFFFFQALDDLLRLIAILVASDLDLVAARSEDRRPRGMPDSPCATRRRTMPLAAVRSRRT